MFVDFDDTLYIHEHHWSAKKEQIDYDNSLAEGVYPFGNELWNKILYELLWEMKDNNAEIKILTVHETDAAAKGKHIFADSMEPKLFSEIIRVNTIQ